MRVYSHENTEHWPQNLINLLGYLIHFKHSFVECVCGFSLLILEEKKKSGFL